jgi:hypothetical protein
MYDALRAMDRDLVLEKLKMAETASLLLTLVEVTRDASYLQRWGAHIQGATTEQTDFPEHVKRSIREKFVEALFDGSTLAGSPTEDPDICRALFNGAAGRQIPDEEQNLLLKDGPCPDRSRWKVGRRP